MTETSNKPKLGRPVGSKDAVPQVPGWRPDTEEAVVRGVGTPQLRRQEKAGIGPKPVRYGRHKLYPIGGFETYLEKLHAQQSAPPVQRGRGRPRKYGREGDVTSADRDRCARMGRCDD